MKDDEFREWMLARGLTALTASTRISDARRVERQFGDLDTAYDTDRCQNILDQLAYTAADKAAGKPNPSPFEIDGDLVASLSSYRSSLIAYSQFRGGDVAGDPSQADRIRAFVISNYVEPARRQSSRRLTIRAGDVHRAMNLQDAMPAVCSVLGGQKLWGAAGITQVGREGPPNGSNAVFHYEFKDGASFDVAVAEARLRDRYGEPIEQSQKMVSFALPDDRAVALQRDISKVQLWLEDDGQVGAPPAQIFQHYTATQGRHSNLPSRLSHQPSATLSTDGFPKAVLSVRVSTATELDAVLNWYGGKPGGLNHAALERMKQTFLARYTDFEPDGFAKNDGSYFAEERQYKDKLLSDARAALEQSNQLTDQQLGARFLDLLTGKESGLLGWRTDGRIKNLRAANPELEGRAGALVRNLDDPPAAIEAFVQATWPLLAAGQEKNLPYSESRNLPTMLAALARPMDAYGINTEPVQRTHRALTHTPAFGSNPLTAQEFVGVVQMAHKVYAVMRDQWHWQPRDLWDVQGFIWAVNRSDNPDINEPEASAAGAPAMLATNIILYGPPGTGKTYATTTEAVRLCDGSVPATGDEIKKRYDVLVEAGQIAFVTFHQSYSYEDFVEGLRPTTAGLENEDGQAQAGFRLEPRKGAFRELASLAEQARTHATQPGGFDLSGRNFVKMSLGQAGVEDYIYDAAIEGNYVVLGWGGNVDWSDPKYESYDEVFSKWNEIEPGTSGNAGNISQIWKFRGGIKKGDLIIVSDGNSRFRAIGEVTGDYRFEPTGIQTYNHRRDVRWLLVLDDSLPVDTIYDGKFSMASCYGLKNAKVKKEALSRLLPGNAPPTDAQPDQFVLIIDEINRGNISKVFGELITLIEPDKRLGAPNELRLKLPYSGDTFGVPNNLHIVGTMNTADRSIALLDTALRRRFDFRELMPQPDVLAETVEGVPLRRMLQIVNERIEYLFDREHQIGHAYFIGCKSRAAIDRTMRDKIIPLLQEYFYEDWAKVAMVLGDADGAANFVERKNLKAPEGASTDFASDERYRWTVKDVFAPLAYAQFK